MRRLEMEDAEVLRIAIQQEILRSEDSRYDHRLHGLLLICSGRSCYEVAELLGQSARSVQYWVHRFQHRGFAGLQDGVRPGRPAALDEAGRVAAGRDLRRPPRELGYEQTLWDGKLLSYHLAKRYGVRIGVRQCQRLFRTLGFRRRKPRSVIANADPAARGAYKKTPAPRRHRRC